MKRLIRKPAVTVGLIVGAILTLAIAGSLDIFLPMGQEGWSDSIRKTVFRYLGHPWEEVLALRIAIGTVAILAVTCLGAVIGAGFSLGLSWFFRKMFHLLDKYEEK